MSTFFQGTNGGNDGIQLFSVVLPQVSDPIKAHPIKNIGFCIVSLVGQVILNENSIVSKHIIQISDVFVFHCPYESPETVKFIFFGIRNSL